MSAFDAIVAGAGPAGSVCAATLAAGGKRVLLLDRARFPRDKVCGDCLNPSAWPILDRLGLRERLRRLPHRRIERLRFVGIDGWTLEMPVSGAEIAIRRREFDSLLVECARELGAEVREDTPVSEVSGCWQVNSSLHAPVLIAADGRNSTIARRLGLLPAGSRERVAIQCHYPAPDAGALEMRFHSHGYGGLAPVSDSGRNLCLVASPDRLDELRAQYGASLPPGAEWRTIAPLARAPAREIARDGLFLVGDAARVVEPFTGEGIYYAMRSGELAAQAILAGPGAEETYRRAHREMYRGRMWINHAARLAGRHPRVASTFLRRFPGLVRMLARRVVDRA